VVVWYAAKAVEATILNVPSAVAVLLNSYRVLHLLQKMPRLLIYMSRLLQWIWLHWLLWLL
jgi:hypothetical protein